MSEPHLNQPIWLRSLSC